MIKANFFTPEQFALFGVHFAYEPELIINAYMFFVILIFSILPQIFSFLGEIVNMVSFFVKLVKRGN